MKINEMPQEIVELIINNMKLKDLCNSIETIDSFKNCFLNNLDKFLVDYDMITYNFDKSNDNLIDHFINISKGHWEYIY